MAFIKDRIRVWDNVASCGDDGGDGGDDDDDDDAVLLFFRASVVLEDGAFGVDNEDGVEVVAVDPE